MFAVTAFISLSFRFWNIFIFSAFLLTISCSKRPKSPMITTEFIKNCDMMWKQSVWSSAIAAGLAARHLKDGGLLTLPGAQPALKGTSGMIGYGMAKAAVHHLVQSLAEDKSGLPSNALAVAILPVTLDTPMNRKWMPKADHSTWTPLEFIGDLFAKWTANEDRPANGSLIQLITKDNKTDLVIS